MISEDPSRSARKISAREKKLKKKKFQKRLLYGTLGAAVFCSVFWLIALTTDYWAHLVLPDGGVKLTSRQDGLQTTVIVTKLYIGLWRHCRVEWTNVTVANSPAPQLNATIGNSSTINDVIGSGQAVQLIKHELCSQHSFYPSLEELEARGLDQGLLDYRRAATGMAVIGLIMAVIANSFSYYSIVCPRYVIRRLTGCMHFVTAACLVSSIQIFDSAVSYARQNVPSIYPPETLYHVFGFSFGIAWVCFAVFIIAGFMFLFHSRKDKSTDKDQPVNIGR